MATQGEGSAVEESNVQKTESPQSARRVRISGALAVGLFFAALAIVLSLVGLWRQDNLTLRNAVLAIALGGGTWGLISWAVATAVLDVEEDVASRGNGDG